jgi:ribonuclease Z
MRIYAAQGRHGVEIGRWALAGCKTPVSSWDRGRPFRIRPCRQKLYIHQPNSLGIHKALGVPDGPVRKELAEGRPVTLADGRTIDADDVLGPPEGRKKLVVIGDTETTEGLDEHVRDADVLVIEATFLDRDAAIARDYGHLTAGEAAALAAKSAVKQLVLTRISGRYPDEDILAEASKMFPDSRVATDFDHISI